MSSFYVEITPRGIRRTHLSLRGRVAEVVSLSHQVMELVYTGLRVENFGTVLGQSWLIIDPLLQAALYFFLIKIILGVAGNDVSLLFIFTAVTFWRSHQVLLSGAPNLIRARAMFFLQVNLSLQAAYYEVILSEFALALLRFLVLGCVVAIFHGRPTLSWLYVFFVLLAQFCFSAAIMIWLSIVGTFIRDVARIVPVMITVWWFTSPGLYSITRVPNSIRWVFDLNPFTYIFDAYKIALLEGRVADFGSLLIVIGVSIVIGFLGTMMLGRARYFFFRYI